MSNINITVVLRDIAEQLTEDGECDMFIELIDEIAQAVKKRYATQLPEAERFRVFLGRGERRLSPAGKKLMLILYTEHLFRTVEE